MVTNKTITHLTSRGEMEGKYGKYSKQTQDFITEVEKFLVKKYGDIQPHWEGQIELLAINYDIFIQAQEKVNEEGLLVQNRFGGFERHPLLSVIRDAHIQINKAIHEFGLSPSALSKIKESSTDEEEDVIKGLING